MPNWNELLDEISAAGSKFDIIRRKYLSELYDLTGRNVIIYYSGWLQKKGVTRLEVNDADKNGLMTVIHNLDTAKGLDLLLHTPGGETAATESIVDYLRAMFGDNMRAFIPQLAMSAGTMIACACKEIVMGKQSSLGPVDPQFQGIAAHGVVEEFNRALQAAQNTPQTIPIWQQIVAKYPPAFVQECEKAIDWSNDMVSDWLLTGMFKGRKTNAKIVKVQTIVTELSDHALSKSHDRHLSYDKCKSIGLKVTRLEQNPALQDAVLSVHHACIHTLSTTAAVKIIENHEGTAFIQQAAQQQVLIPGRT